MKRVQVPKYFRAFLPISSTRASRSDSLSLVVSLFFFHRPGVNGMVAWTTTTSDGRRSVSLSPPTIGGAHSPSSPLSNEMTLWTSSSEVSPREHDDKIINSSDHGRGSTKRRHEGSPPRFDDDDSSDGNTAVSVMVPQRPQAGHAASSLVDSYVTRTMTAVRVECASTTPPVVGVTSPAELFAIAVSHMLWLFVVEY